MAGIKETQEIELNRDQLGFLKSTLEKYRIPDQSKAVRVLLDYVITNPDIQDTVFSDVRCLRCE